MIARIWRGVTLESNADEYLRYLMATGLKDYRKTEGNRSAQVFRRIQDGMAEFVLISLWDSFDAIRRFAGEDIEKAVYYPEDQKYLLAIETKVVHYEVLFAG